jgi:xanthine dehydrogenase accessory factor
MHPGFLSPSQLASLLLDATEQGERVAVFVVVSHPDPKQIGGRVLFRGRSPAEVPTAPRSPSRVRAHSSADTSPTPGPGEMGPVSAPGLEEHGAFPDPAAHQAARELGTRGIGGDLAVLPGLHALPLEGGGEMLVYLELHHQSPEMVIVGAGHVAQPLCTLGALLGLRVRVLDDRPAFATRERFPEAHELRKVDFSDPFAGVPLHSWTHVVLVTRGHRYDYECLRRILLSPSIPAYIGMIGSRRRVRATFEALVREGIEPELLWRVQSPIGLDIGAETPAEIAVSVAAEIVHLWRGGSCRPMREAEGILERFVMRGEE